MKRNPKDYIYLPKCNLFFEKKSFAVSPVCEKEITKEIVKFKNKKRLWGLLKDKKIKQYKSVTKTQYYIECKDSNFYWVAQSFQKKRITKLWNELVNQVIDKS